MNVPLPNKLNKQLHSFPVHKKIIIYKVNAFTVDPRYLVHNRLYAANRICAAVHFIPAAEAAPEGAAVRRSDMSAGKKLKIAVSVTVLIKISSVRKRQSVYVKWFCILYRPSAVIICTDAVGNLFSFEYIRNVKNIKGSYNMIYVFAEETSEIQLRVKSAYDRDAALLLGKPAILLHKILLPCSSADIYCKWRYFRKSVRIFILFHLSVPDKRLISLFSQQSIYIFKLQRLVIDYPRKIILCTRYLRMNKQYSPVIRHFFSSSAISSLYAIFPTRVFGKLSTKLIS